MKFEYQLIYKGSAGSSGDSRRQINEVIQDLLKVSAAADKIIDLDNPPSIVQRSPSRDELHKTSKRLEEVGVATEIRRVPHTLTQQVERTSSESASFHGFFQQYSASLQHVMQQIDVEQVAFLARSLMEARERKAQIFVLGNGGSAAAASHFVTDLAKNRFEDERSLFRVLSLTDNTAWITATGNDFGYDNLFVNQLKNLLQPEDIVIAISSSGNSANVLKAIEYANSKGARSFGIVGFDGGKLKEMCHHPVYIPTKKGHYGFMEDATSILGHMVSIFIYEQDCKVWG
jgi:D-sedoheptulose 7-phosphate isomerase